MLTPDIDNEQAALDARLAGIALPAGASTDGWLSIRVDDGCALRSLQWSYVNGPGALGIGVCGWQSEDGSYTRSVVVYGDADELTAQQARDVAAALVQAADRLDELERA